jgi:phosphatidylglycerophosphate synthase
MSNDLDDRRPIATRERKLSQRIAGTLAGWGISANAISIAGLFSGIAAGAALWATSWDGSCTRWCWFAGALLVQGRLLANMLDGMVAQLSGKNSPVGALYNEVPDRIEDAVILIGLGYAVGSCPALGYLAAIAAVFTAYVRAMNKVAGAPQDFCGPLAKPQRMFVVTIAALYCAVTPISWQSIMIGDDRWHVSAAMLLLIFAGSLFTAGRRLRRAAAALKSDCHE